MTRYAFLRATLPSREEYLNLTRGPDGWTMDAQFGWHPPHPTSPAIQAERMAESHRIAREEGII